ncbi:hypothetical protein LWI28_002124 [Acer negundo]|uniref:Ubiquitin thioesterase OTU n=1 Tax=Acer negundo TaxID=4023 RepID=A0AAD5IF55_ACENE|nr:hypothetical protein LWI28_002124 [Acer negundo]
MIVSASISTCAKNVVQLSGRFQGQMGGSICRVTSRGPSNSCCFHLYSGHSKNNYAAHAEASPEKKDEEDDCDLSYVKYSHGKKVCTYYSVIGIPGDGRCLFRSVAHGACLRAGKPPPTGNHQRELADDLRARDSGGLVSIAEYGQEYGTENPIRVLYHGFGHYDALHFPGEKGSRSKL